MTIKTVHRFDVGEIKSPTITPQGYLKSDGFATRTGVFEYMMYDGTIVREFRHPDDVFDAESLKSLAGIPLTNDHPPDFLNSENTSKFQVGFTGDNAEQVDDFVKVGTTITDEKAIDDVMKNNKRELSCGYTCKLVDEQGEWFGVQYDYRQTEVVYNHLSIVDMGRAGPEAKLKLDTEDNKQVRMDAAFMVKKLDAAPEENKRGLRKTEKSDKPCKTRKQHDKKGEKVMAKLKVGNVEIEIEDAGVAQAVDKFITDHEELKKTVDELKSTGDKAQATADAAADEIKKKDEQIKTLEDSKPSMEDMRKDVEARIALEALATEHLGEEAKFDGKTDIEIKKLVIEKLSETTDITDKSDDYINAHFDAVIEFLKKENGNEDGIKILNGKKVNEDDELEKARKDRKEKDSKKWQTPCPARASLK